MYSGKAIYQPTGKAGEYARWACNYYVGCSNDCHYCYCKKGALGTVAGGKKPVLKACFHDVQHAFETFVDEMTRHVDPRTQRFDLVRRGGGLFFSFTTDPCLPETVELTMLSVMFATGLRVPCHILTKCTGWMEDENIMSSLLSVKNHVAIGFTLTGMDEMEKGPTVATNDERLAAMRKLHENGFKTFASFEPVIDFGKAAWLFEKSLGVCDLYKFGLLSGKRDYDAQALGQFIDLVTALSEKERVPVYWKQSFQKCYGQPIVGPMCVDDKYTVFDKK